MLKLKIYSVKTGILLCELFTNNIPQKQDYISFWFNKTLVNGQIECLVHTFNENNEFDCIEVSIYSTDL